MRAVPPAAKSWPKGFRTAAVGPHTAARVLDAGPDPPPLVAAEAGADALWSVLRDADDWPLRRVLVPALAGGRQELIEGLLSAGADVRVVEAYRVVDIAPERIAARWTTVAPAAVVLASPSAARALVNAVGAGALRSLRAVAAIGHTTAAPLAECGIVASVPARAGFAALPGYLAAMRDDGVDGARSFNRDA